MSTLLPERLVIGVEEALPQSLRQAIHQIIISDTNIITAPTTAPTVTLRLENSPAGPLVYTTIFAAATRFNSTDTAIQSSEISALWRGTAAEGLPYTEIAVLSSTLPSLITLLGPAGPTVVGHGDLDTIIDAVWARENSLAILPFEALTPELTVLAVDGNNPVENTNRFDADTYFLALPFYANSGVPSIDSISTRLRTLSGGSNRHADELTVIAMTGVTAMVRQTAAQMDQLGVDWPARVVGPELAAADITAISNEVPFVNGCETNTDPANLTFCSPPSYMATLEAVGTDIIGLTGNHQNDYGRAAALESLQIYADVGIPVYGAGRTKAEAFAPLYLEHNGNRLAFIGANSYGPPLAWAGDDTPGSAEFDLNIMSATIRAIKENDRADVVLAELQYQESYDVQPLYDQRDNFRALVWAGADVVTGVQSHVPQAMEFEEGNLILYGLGNLFFDQMQGTTREGMIVKHTIYAGRHMSTQILTTIIEDYGQPRWTTPEERQQILGRVLGASYWEHPTP